MLGEDWGRNYPTVGVGRILEHVEEPMVALLWQQTIKPKHMSEFTVKQQS